MGRRSRIIGVVMGAALVANPGGAVATDASRAVFSWQDPDPALVAAAVAAGQDELWVHTRPGTTNDGALAATAAAGAAAGLEVAALAGDPTWADRARAHALAWTTETAAVPGIDHLVLDIEPHLLPDWAKGGAQRRKLVDRFVGTLAEAKARAGDHTVSAVIPFWYDEIPASSGRGTLLDQIATVVDGIVVMAYRDTPEAQLALLGEERRVAAATGTRLWVALEVTEQEPAYISYFGQDRAAVDRAVATIEQALAGDAMFAGTAVHTLEAYAAMP